MIYVIGLTEQFSDNVIIFVVANGYRYGIVHFLTLKTQKTMTKEEVLRIIDNCFHMYASDYRIDAVKEAERQIDAIERSNAQKNEFAIPDVSVSLPDPYDICKCCAHPRKYCICSNER